MITTKWKLWDVAGLDWDATAMMLLQAEGEESYEVLVVQLEYNLLQVMVVVAIDCYKEQVEYNIHPTYEAFDTDAQDVERRGNVTKSARTKSFSKQTTFVLYIAIPKPSSLRQALGIVIGKD